MTLPDHFLYGIRDAHVDQHVARVHSEDIALIDYAEAGYAKHEINTSITLPFGTRSWNTAEKALKDDCSYVCYNYEWKNMKYLVYAVSLLPREMYYIVSCHDPNGKWDPDSLLDERHRCFARSRRRVVLKAAWRGI